MTVINKKVVVPYSSEQMYQLVNEIELYPEFVPACESSQILSRTIDEVRASLTFAQSGIRKSFATLNRLQPHKMIEIRLLNGPFHNLEGFWRFDHLENNYCQVVLDLEFEFSSRILGMMFGPIFTQVTN